MEERLQKYMARCGVASRRKCEELILSGVVKVNDNIVNELGVKINSAYDKVVVAGRTIFPEENKIYIMLNKPEGYITSVKDEKDRKTVLDIVKVKERIFPVGRLDYDSSGLLLLTNDGDIYNRIIHPRVEIKKKYLAIVKGSFSAKEIEAFERGVDIGGYITAPCKIDVIENLGKQSKVRIEIHEGKNRQIRRMCAAFNHEVLKLKRETVGKLSLGNLEKGQWRYLNEDEIKYLKSL